MNARYQAKHQAHAAHDKFDPRYLASDLALPAVSLVFVGNRDTPGTLAVLDALIRPHARELPGLLARWRHQPATRVYAVMDLAANQPVGLVAWTGPTYRADSSWWIHEGYRGQGLGKAAIERLAAEMKRVGVRALKSPIKIQTPGGRYDAQSAALAVWLRASVYVPS